MANRKKEVYKPKPMTEGKRNLIQGLLQEYDIQSAEDIQDALKDLLSGTIQDMLETEMDDHLGYDRYERSGEPNYRNGMKSKTVRSKYGEFQVDVPQDRQSSFEPQILPKRQKDISSIDDKIISMYAKGMTTRQISETIEDIYGFEVSEGMVSDITDKLLPRIEEWQNRPCPLCIRTLGSDPNVTNFLPLLGISVPFLTSIPFIKCFFRISPPIVH